MTVILEYVPCNCSSPVHERVVVKDANGVAREYGEARVTPNVEHYDEKHVAAARFRQLSAEGKPRAVHHRGMHVGAVTIDGVRWD